MNRAFFITLLFFLFVLPKSSWGFNWHGIQLRQCDSVMMHETRAQLFSRFNEKVLEKLNSAPNFQEWKEVDAEKITLTYQELLQGKINGTYEKPILRLFPDGTLFRAYRTEGKFYNDFDLSPTTTSATIHEIYVFRLKQLEAELAETPPTSLTRAKEVLEITIKNIQQTLPALSAFDFNYFYTGPYSIGTASAGAIEYRGFLKKLGSAVSFHIWPGQTKLTNIVGIAMNGINRLRDLPINVSLKLAINQNFEITVDRPALNRPKLLMACKTSILECLSVIDRFGKAMIDENIIYTAIHESEDEP